MFNTSINFEAVMVNVKFDKEKLNANEIKILKTKYPIINESASEIIISIKESEVVHLKARFAHKLLVEISE